METEIKNSIKNKLGIIIRQYNKVEYADISSYYELHSNWKSSEYTIHPLFETIRSECKKQLKEMAKSEIEKRTQDKQQMNTKQNIKLKELFVKLDVHEVIDCLNEIFKFHANIMYSHHSMIAFHEHKHSRMLYFHYNIL